MPEHRKRFSDFARKHIPLEGVKVSISDVLNKEITVLNYRLTGSKFNTSGNGRCLHMQFSMDGELSVLFTGSSVLAEQIETYKEHLPFDATIKQIGKFFTFT